MRGGDAQWRGSMPGPSNLCQQWSSALHILAASQRKTLSGKPLAEAHKHKLLHSKTQSYALVVYFNSARFKLISRFIINSRNDKNLPMVTEM